MSNKYLMFHVNPGKGVFSFALTVCNLSVYILSDNEMLLPCYLLPVISSGIPGGWKENQTKNHTIWCLFLVLSLISCDIKQITTISGSQLIKGDQLVIIKIPSRA